MAQSGYGKILLFNDFCGPEIPVANAVAYGTTAGGCHYYLGDYKITGDLADTDAGVVGLAKAGGWVRLTGTNEDNAGCAAGTEAVFSPALNGTIAVEARVETQALTARNLFVGLCDVNNDASLLPPCTGDTVTMTLTASDLVGFCFDSQLTNGNWMCVYNGGSTTGATATAGIDSLVTLVAAQSDVLRVEVDPDGRARWYVNGELKFTVAGAVSTTVLQGTLVGCFATTTTITDLDVDYIATEANRDWTV
jgi:hypothetical protein